MPEPHAGIRIQAERSRTGRGIRTMLRVRHLLHRKGYDVWSVDVDEPVLEAIQIMADRHIGALPVLRNGELAGMVS